MISTKKLEVECKYTARNVVWEEFVSKVKKYGPYKHVRIKGPDTYYVTPNGQVLRWRHSLDKAELTIKQRTSARTSLVRIENDLSVADNSVRNVLSHIRLSGNKKLFRIYKDCEIFWLKDKFGSVSIVIYDVFCKNIPTKRFIEIEAEKGQDFKQSKRLVRIWEKRLGININCRISKSLYEIYSGKTTPLMTEEAHCGRCGKILSLNNFVKRKNGKVKAGERTLGMRKKK